MSCCKAKENFFAVLQHLFEHAIMAQNVRQEFTEK